MNLFETNQVLAVKLSQPISELYKLPFYEYKSYVDLVMQSTGASTQETFEIPAGNQDLQQGSLG